jgi:hypothetical protein
LFLFVNLFIDLRKNDAGQYSLAWMPDISGKYVVIATFPGTNCYWPSLAEASFVVDQPAATPASTQTHPTMSEVYFLPSVAGIILAIAVGFAEQSLF